MATTKLELLSRLRDFLAMRFLEYDRQIHSVRGYTPGGEIPEKDLPKTRALIAMRELHDAAISLGISHDVLAEAESKGWIARGELIAPGGRRSQFYEIMASVLTDHSAPRQDPDDQYYPASYYKQFRISDDTLRKASKNKREPIASQQRGRLHYYRLGDVKKRWPHQFIGKPGESTGI